MLVTLLSLLVGFAFGQDDLGSGNGFLDINTANFNARIVSDAQVLASLQPNGNEFDFLPFDLIDVRSRNGQYHWGDITYRYREEGGGEWISGDSAQDRQPVDTAPADGEEVLAASDLSPTIPQGPLSVIREWLDVEGDLGLRFTIENTADSTIEIGSLGFPAEFNSIFTNRRAVDIQRVCSLSEPYVGMDAGQIRVTPVRGTGAALVVTALNGTKSPFEAYRNLNEPSFSETNYGSQTFEGFYEWQVLTKAWAENEWSGAQPWNTASSMTLQPGEALQFGVRFSVSQDGIRGYDDTVRGTGTPVAMGVPGYILPRDLPGQLFLQADSGVTSIVAEPEGALDVSETGSGSYTVTPSESALGRVRLTVEYGDGTLQTIHYYITKPASETLGDMGQFLTTEAYFDDTSDPFGRAPSVLSYDHDEMSLVEQDSRVWIAGLSDEGGSGAYVAAVLKQSVNPAAEEVRKLDDFVNTVLWGNVQLEDNSVRKSVFFYDPQQMPNYNYDSSLNWGSWTSWNKASAYAIDRAYNYVHPSGAYWSLYRVARAYPDLVSQSWDWYLERAYGSIIRCVADDVGYNDMGLMGETVWGEILKDLVRENQTDKAQDVEEAMRARADHWNSIEVPYGSEMAWDSTGQEGVYYWSKHFGNNDLAERTVDSVLGFTPTVPHWGWNGNSHRYWDFIYAGKLQRIERQIHHYASALNAQVLLSAFRDDPSDLYLLRVGYGGIIAPLSNIHEDGCPSAAFHSYPETLRWDGYTGDYGPGFLGMVLNSGTYVSQTEDVGLVAHGGIISTDGNSVTVQPRELVKKRVFIGPLGVLISIDAGIIEEVTYDTDSQSISVTLSQLEGAPQAENIVIWTESTSGPSWAVEGDNVTPSRNGSQVPMAEARVTVQLSPT